MLPVPYAQDLGCTFTMRIRIGPGSHPASISHSHQELQEHHSIWHNGVRLRMEAGEGVPRLPVGGVGFSKTRGVLTRCGVCDAQEQTVEDVKSGRTDSNRRHSAWEADVLPLNYARITKPARMRLSYVARFSICGYINDAVSMCQVRRIAACVLCSDQVKERRSSSLSLIRPDTLRAPNARSWSIDLAKFRVSLQSDAYSNSTQWEGIIE